MARKFSLDSQIAEVRREIEQRRTVYPRLVSQRKISDERAELQIELMGSVLTTLEWLRQNEAAIRAALAEEKGLV